MSIKTIFNLNINVIQVHFCIIDQKKKVVDEADNYVDKMLNFRGKVTKP